PFRVQDPELSSLPPVYTITFWVSGRARDRSNALNGSVHTRPKSGGKKLHRLFQLLLDRVSREIRRSHPAPRPRRQTAVLHELFAASGQMPHHPAAPLAQSRFMARLTRDVPKLVRDIIEMKKFLVAVACM